MPIFRLKTSPLPEALLVIFFAYFLHVDGPIAFACIVGFFLMVFLRLWKESSGQIQETLGLERCGLNWIMGCSLVGIALATLLRWSNNDSLIPIELKPFLLVAVCIGVSEELIFRGYFLSRLQLFAGTWISIILSSLIHSSYKIAIFVPFPSADILTLGSLTFMVGLLIGYARIATNSIWPCVVSHAIFDLWVYGDKTTPWWVW